MLCNPACALSSVDFRCSADFHASLHAGKLWGFKRLHRKCGELGFESSGLTASRFCSWVFLGGSRSVPRTCHEPFHPTLFSFADLCTGLDVTNRDNPLMHVCIHNMFAHTHTHARARTHTHTRARAHTHTHIFTHAHVVFLTCARMYIRNPQTLKLRSCASAVATTEGSRMDDLQKPLLGS